MSRTSKGKASSTRPKNKPTRVTMATEINKEKLKAILTYHVVAGKMDAGAVVAAITAGKGKAVLTSVNGAKLTATLKGDKVVLTDSKGGTATVTATRSTRKFAVDIFSARETPLALSSGIKAAIPVCETCVVVSAGRFVHCWARATAALSSGMR